MFLSKWIERGNLGQILAPDANYKANPDQEERKFFQAVAPDPQGKAPSQPPSAAPTPLPQAPTKPPPQLDSPPPPGCVQCEHCHKFTRLPPSAYPTPVASSTVAPFQSPALETPAASKLATSAPGTSFHTPFETPSTSLPISSRKAPESVQSMVLRTAGNVANALASPIDARKPDEELLAFCSLPDISTLTGEKRIAKRQKMTQKHARRLQANPRLFHTVSGSSQSNAIPSGYTPLMTAAYADHPSAARLLLELGPSSQLMERNLQGGTALHIASERGHVDMAAFLQDQMRLASAELSMDAANSPSDVFDPEQPQDLLGHTPYGSAMISPEFKAKQRRSQLKQLLEHPRDISVVGTPAPVLQRLHSYPVLGLQFGHADKPGHRILSEDAMAWHVPEADEAYALLVVCDGHGDNGLVANYVANELKGAVAAAVSMSGDDWDEKLQDVNLGIDDKLKATSMKGGCTAVYALVWGDKIIVANLGDSRCILVQKPSLESDLEQLSLQESDTKPATNKCTVVDLSHDHKPNAKTEQERIEAAGLKVFAAEFTDDNGVQQVIHKVSLNDGEGLLGTSRAFGDFEYKANKELAADHQAVTAIPDVVVQPRNADTDAFLVIACDGIWDVMTSQEVGDFVMQQTGPLPLVGDALLDECLNRGSEDNMSVILANVSLSIPTAQTLFGDDKVDVPMHTGSAGAGDVDLR